MLKFIPVLLILFSISVFAQKADTVQVFRKKGRSSELVVKFYNYNGTYVLIDNDNEKLTGRIGHVNSWVNEADIAKLVAPDGSIYNVISAGGKYLLGQFITQGKINIFKVYIVAGASGGTSSLSIAEEYYEIGARNVRVSKKAYLIALAKQCRSFKRYKKKHKSMHKTGFDNAVVFYNASCN